MRAVAASLLQKVRLSDVRHQLRQNLPPRASLLLSSNLVARRARPPASRSDGRQPAAAREWQHRPAPPLPPLLPRASRAPTCCTGPPAEPALATKRYSEAQALREHGVAQLRQVRWW